MQIDKPAPQETDIVREVDEALWQAVRTSERDMRNEDFVIVLNTAGRNEFMHQMVSTTIYTSTRKQERYRGAILAVTHDEESPRVAIFSRPKQTNT